MIQHKMLSLIQNLFKVMAFLKSILQYFKRIHMNTINRYSIK